MNCEKTAIVLGGTVPHIRLVQKLKDRGYRVVLVDYYPNPPAKPFVDKHVQASTLDQEMVLKIAIIHHADLVISACVDQANAVCCYVSEKLGLTRPYSFQTSLDATDKGRMKEKFVLGGIPTARYFVTNKVPKGIGLLKYPLVVKPVDANSSKGVRRVDTARELNLYSEKALAFSRSGRIIVEEFCKGKEIQIDCLAIGGKAKILMTREKKQLQGKSIVLNSRGSYVPANLNHELMLSISDIAQKICTSFDLESTPFFIQAKIDCGQVSVLEFAPRIGGGLSTELIRIVTNVDVLDYAIDSYLNKPFVRPIIRDTDKKYVTLLLYMQKGVFDHIEGLEKLEESGSLEYAAILKRKGDVVTGEANSGNRVASVILSASSSIQLESAIARAYSTLRIINNEGRSCMLESHILGREASNETSSI